MSKYVLIHGAWHGGWCWDKVVPLLEFAGHQVEVPDLPGSGQDHTSLQEVTLAAYTERVVNILDASSEPVFLNVFFNSLSKNLQSWNRALPFF